MTFAARLATRAGLGLGASTIATGQSCVARGIARPQAYSTGAGPSADTDILQRLRGDLSTALKAKNKSVSTPIRSLLSEITYAQKQQTPAASTAATVAVVPIIRKAIKKRQESADAFRANQRDDLAMKEEEEAKFLAAYLPAQLTPAQVDELVRQIALDLGVKGPKDMGKVMKEANVRIDESVAPRKVVADAVKRMISSL
ncbi:Yqey-like protein-domain-containing protein [Fimicolochytrium jonesii]|uniref:Yqey-like protein-domain-containing protein n=1 Tax=Fimicolochytrium jonesii TaxID=1396493 RepID=UPI0022FEBDD8|nr:Yqey-like protein-domain-containing protein [Fimicolochytrium jonesii]KAI8819927.1 Yqey-like protein-domain-containing protein [Fimicolochytrium jonesii]